jgi:carbon monoxide dehydrogenase subunit G
MNLQGERIIPASVEKTWLALNDPQTLKACIAGCESIDATGENQYLAVMAVRIGPVNAKFKGRLQLSDIVALQSYKINFDGQGGVAGFGKGSANVSLLPEGTSGEATRLNYTADAQVGGKIAQIGSRLVESAAAKIADDFFKAFEARMTAPVAPATPATRDGGTGVATDAAAFSAAGAGAAPAVAPITGDDAVPPRPASTLDHVAGRDARPDASGGGSAIWWIAGIIVLALLVYFFTR